jgi:hypothetical protein
MIDFTILEKHGTSDQRLKEIFTAHGLDDHQLASMDEKERKDHEKKIKTREFFESRIRSRQQEGVARNMREYKRNAAADIAWDGPPIQKDMMPLLKYAQNNMGKVEVNREFSELNDGDRFIDSDSGNATLNLPKFVQVHCNLVRHFVTRRLAGQSNKYSNLYPFYAYDSRSTDSVGKLRADAVSQRMDIMADEFGHRHHDVQCYRDAFLYSHVVDFVRSAWEQDKHWRKKDGGDDIEEFIEREGVSWVNPHPSRVFYDDAHPLSSINYDNGCQYVGYWDIVRYGEVSQNGMFWNKNAVKHSTYLWDIFNQNAGFFTKYYGTIRPPEMVQDNEKDPAGGNDRANQVGQFAGMREDTPILLMQYFEKIIPKEHNIGDYPYPVWVRFITAGDNTVVHAEIMPSRPAAFLTYNDSDTRADNISFAHELMPYQDAMNNLLNAMVSLIEAECVKVFLINKDALDPAVRAHVRKKLEGKDWAAPLTVEVSNSQLQELGVDLKNVFTIAETRASQQTLESILRGMAQLIGLVEKMIAMSPAELGQPAPREISATEVTQIAQTTTTVFSFISDGIDAWREAKKRIQYESLIACGEQKLIVPVINRYTKEVITKAGFEIYEEQEDTRGPQTIVGTIDNLRHTMVFSSRDGAERPQNVKAAQSLVQLLQLLAGDEAIRAELGKERLFELINEIGRLTGAKFDIKLEGGESNDFGIPPDVTRDLLQQNLNATEQNNTDIAALLQQAGIDPAQLRQVAGQVQGAGLQIVQ